MIYAIYYQRFFGLLRPLETKLKYLSFTHRLVRQVEADSLDEVYGQMQGEVWSPHGEARGLIKSLHLSHTSLSVGDVVEDPQADFWVCNHSGWLPLQTERFRPNEQPKVELPPLWMATEANFLAAQPQVTRLKISDERDCLLADAYTVEQFGWTLFADLLALAKLIEQRLGLAVCLDLGADFYETEASDEESYKSYVGYYLTGRWHNPIISVLAPSPETAQARIEEELRKPGRHRYRQLWVRDGRQVKEKKEETNGQISR